jgi:hypothetical protein
LAEFRGFRDLFDSPAQAAALGAALWISLLLSESEGLRRRARR